MLKGGYIETATPTLINTEPMKWGDLVTGQANLATHLALGARNTAGFSRVLETLAVLESPGQVLDKGIFSDCTRTLDF